MTQEDYFGFLSRPFQAAPQEGLFVPLEPMRDAVEQLSEAARKGDGVGVLTAVSGAGKTVVCCELKARLSDEFVAVLLPSCTYPTRRSLLQAILFQLGEDFAGLTEQEARLSLLSIAQSSLTHHAGIVLIVDEAHQLSPRLLEELRCLTNHVEHGQPLIRIILSGQLALEERLTLPELQALNYRVSCHTTLEPLSMYDSAEFIEGRMAHIGQSTCNFFAQDALEIICRVSDGSPRCLNQLADACLSHAAEAEVVPVTGEDVRTVLQTLKQLPLQWNESVCDRLLEQEEDQLTRDFPVKPRTQCAPCGEDEAVEESFALNSECSAIQAGRGHSDDDTEPSWNSNVTSIEVGAAPSRPTETESQERREAEMTCNESIENRWDASPIEAVETIEIRAIHKVTNAADEQDTTVPVADRTEMKSNTELQELSIDDRYAALDRRREKGAQFQEQDDLTLPLNWSKPVERQPESVAQEENSETASEDHLHEFEEGMNQAIAEIESLPTGSRIGRMIKALSDVVANELSRDLSPHRRSSSLGRIVHASDGDATKVIPAAHVKMTGNGAAENWRATPATMAFDVIEPEDHECALETNESVGQHSLEVRGWEDPVESADKAHGQPHLDTLEEAESVSGIVDDAHASIERPYARLFSRARRKRTSA